MKIFKKFLILVLIGIVGVGCSQIKLRSKLPMPIKNWFDIHRPIMEGKVPRWLDSRGGSEAMHFLRLPRAAQVLYIKNFWKIRDEGAKEEYYYRYNYAQKFFDGVNTDMGRVFLICGFPCDIRYKQDYQEQSKNDLAGYRFQMWIYMWRSEFVGVQFEYRFGTWQRSIISISTFGEFTNYTEYCRSLFFPTEDGWDTWGSILKGYLEGN